MTDILSRVNAYVLTKITPYAPIFLNGFQKLTSEEITAIQDPSQGTTKRYLDGSRTGQFNFTYYAKSTDQRKARKQIDDIISVLDFQAFTEIDNVTSVICEVINTTFFKEKSDSLEWVFIGSMRIEYHKQK
jgi:hypothetical protein